MLDEIMSQLRLTRLQKEMVTREIDNPKSTNPIVKFIRQKMDRQLAFERSYSLQHEMRIR